MPVTVASIFRDSTGYLERYFTQVCELEIALGEPVTLVIAEGDSTDGTHNVLYRQLHERGGGDTLLKVDHGGPSFAAVDSPQRWAQIAQVCNAVMDALPLAPTIYVESDLIWEPDTMLQLLKDLEEVPAVAPLCLKGDRFYDVWGHRDIDGARFRPYEPFHDLGDEPLVEIGSAGSCVVMRPDVAQVARFGDNDAIVGLGRDIRFRANASLWLDQRVAVHHP